VEHAFHTLLSKDREEFRYSVPRVSVPALPAPHERSKTKKTGMDSLIYYGGTV
jgi:hypothetical protein